MTKTEYREIQDIFTRARRHIADKHGCGSGKRKEGWDEAFQVVKSLLHDHSNRPLYRSKVINTDHLSSNEKVLGICPYCKGAISWDLNTQPFYRYCSRCGHEIIFE